MKKIIITIFTALVFITINAQTINTTALNSYPASVVIRVHEVASTINLTTTQQTTLADLFQDEEQDIFTLVTTGASAQNIADTRKNYLAIFNNMFTPTQLKTYYTAKNSNKTNTIAKVTALVLQNKYGADSIVKNYFDSIYTWKENSLNNIYNSNTDSAFRSNKLYNAIKAYDSLTSVYVHAAEGSNYIWSKVYYLDSIKPIDSLKKATLFTKYYTLCMQNKFASYSDNFDNAFIPLFNNITDSAYYAFVYYNQLQTNLTNSVKSTIASYTKQFKLSQNAMQQIAPIVLQKEKLVAIINKIYPTYTAAKDSIIDTLTFNYQTQIDNIIAKDGNLINPSQIDIAIKYSNPLGLEEIQITNLQQKLQELTELKNSFKQTNEVAEYDSKPFESETLNAILTAEQYTQVLTTKYNEIAVSMANKDWQQIVKYGFNNYDEQPTKTELTNFHLAVLIAYYRNAYDKEQQYTSVKRIQEMMPEVMKKLVDKWNYKTPFADTPDTFLQW